MLGVPICHGVVRWEVLLHRGNRLSIGCTAWPRGPVDPRLTMKMALRFSWMWCPHILALLSRGKHGLPGPRTVAERVILTQFFQCCQPKCCQPNVCCAILRCNPHHHAGCSDAQPLQFCLQCVRMLSDVGVPPALRAPGDGTELYPELKSPLQVELGVHRQPRCEAAALSSDTAPAAAAASAPLVMGIAGRTCERVLPAVAARSRSEGERWRAVASGAALAARSGEVASGKLGRVSPQAERRSRHYLTGECKPPKPGQQLVNPLQDLINSTYCRQINDISSSACWALHRFGDMARAIN